MECFKVENLSFRYPGRSKNAIDGISFTVNKGEFVTVCGISGCGKSTLLRLLKPSISPHGKLSGSIVYKGKPLDMWNDRDTASGIGFVLQTPDNQIVTDKVWHELAFGLESLGMSTEEIRAKVSEMASFFGIENWFHKPVADLSGGQKQILSLASVMAMQPSVLILDEPTSQLDPIAAQEFIKLLERINRELGTTVIISEHRLYEAFPISDRVIVMDRGHIIVDDTPNNAASSLASDNHMMYEALPAPMRIYAAVDGRGVSPLTVREGRAWFEDYAKRHTLNPDAIPKSDKVSDAPAIIEAKELWFRYEKKSPDVIKGLNLSIKKGELFTILGGNGTGKSTALSIIAGINKPYRGEIKICGKSKDKLQELHRGLLSFLPQDPLTVFLKNTVKLDLMSALDDTKLTPDKKQEKLAKVASLCRIADIMDSHPYDLSGGEAQRAALAKVLLNEPEILLLDEPTKGLDAHFKNEFAAIINDLKTSGVTVIMVSHDIEFCARYADRCALFFDGSVTSVSRPREFFSGMSFYTTSANRMARGVLPEAVLDEDVILTCGGKIHESPRRYGDSSEGEDDEANHDIQTALHSETKPKEKIMPSKRTVLATVLTLIAIPFTIFFGMYFLDDRRYYFISLAVMLETMIPFFALFEKRRPKARELVLISSLCAIAVAGRAAFFMTPNFKPMVAVIIVSSIALGGECGFLVGAVTGFVSNLFFGQGPWTPWQMFALGIIGFIAGLLARSGTLKKKRFPLCIFGALATLIIYGGIMNPSTVLMAQSHPSFEMIAAAYLAGLPFDLIHASSTAIFLWFIADPMIEKLERIKKKFGLLGA